MEQALKLIDKCDSMLKNIEMLLKIVELNYGK